MRRPSRLGLRLAPVLAMGLVALTVTSVAAEPHSLRFRGHGVDAPNADRVRIPLEPDTPIDVGDGDMTVELWLRAPAQAARNDAPAVTCGWGNVDWIRGNIVLDRDRYNADRKYGVSLAAGRVVFGVSGNGTGDRTLCGRTDLRDGRWHHVAVQRRRQDGRLWLFVDGRLERVGPGPAGDISYPDGANPGSYCGPGGTSPCVNDPYLVIGAEKHDAGPAYPSFDGWVDELRISTVLRYTGPFAPRTRPFRPDAQTVALYHLDAGRGAVMKDVSGAAGGPTNGEIRSGGDPVGPVWSRSSPFR